MPSKTPMSEEERRNLAEKLDQELEEFMVEAGAKQNYEKKNNFNWDEWEKDFDSHPAFIKTQSDLQKGAGGDYSSHIEAIKALKDDVGETEEEKVENAEGYKKDGNKNFRLAKYRWAIEAYSNGLKIGCADRKLNGVLLSNRAAAEARIGNKRTAVKDCRSALRFDQQNLKAALKGGECLIEMGYAGDCLSWIDCFLKKYDVVDDGEPLLLKIHELKGKAEKEEEKEERDRRKKRAEAAKDLVEKKKLLAALEERGLNLNPRVPFKNPGLMEWSLLEVSLPQLHNHERVVLNDVGRLQWPILLQYPEMGQMDVMTHVDETTMVGTLLQEVLSSPAEWDPEHKFKMDGVSFFVADEFDEFLMEVYPWTDFKTAFSYPGYSIKRGLPVLMVYTNTKRDASFTQLDGNKFTVA